MASVLVLGACSVIDGLSGGDPDPGIGLPGDPGDPIDPIDPGGPGGPACVSGSFEPRLTLDMNQSPQDMEIDFEGPSLLSRHDDSPDNGTLTFELEGGPEVTLNYRLAGDSLVANAGDQFHVVLQRRKGVTDDLVLAVRQPKNGTADPEGALAIVIWETSDESLIGLASRDLGLTYGNNGCASVNDGCGELAPLDLDVILPGGSTADGISPGTDVSLAGFHMVNGSSTGEYIGPSCPGSTPRRMTGYVLGPKI